MIVQGKEKLLSKCEPCSSVEEGLRISSELIRELASAPGGIGLSAPQIGVDKRVFVIKLNSNLMVFINPEILEKKQPYINKNEGCLSFPGVFIDTIRYKKLSAKDDLNGTFSLEGLEALVFLHEYDHLDGILMFDRAVPDRYDPCFCGSGKKFKFCCFKDA